MNLHSSVHLDLARERRLDSIARTERRKREQVALCGRAVRDPSGEAMRAEISATRPQATSRVTFRELAHRVDGGIDVTLLWSALENRLTVTVFDERAGELVVLDAESDNALDVFYHPYAHADSQAAA